MTIGTPPQPSEAYREDAERVAAERTARMQVAAMADASAVPAPIDPTPTTPGIPAGWYHDPTSGLQRWWDGTRWTENFAPTVIAPVHVTMVRGTNHTFHLIMSLVTVGLWIPVWIIVSIANSGARPR